MQSLLITPKTKSKPKRPAEKIAIHSRGMMAHSTLVSALVFLLLAALQLRWLFGLYGMVAGFVLTFFWPIFFFNLFLLMLANRQRLQGDTHQATLTMAYALAVAFLIVGSFIVLLTDFQFA